MGLTAPQAYLPAGTGAAARRFATKLRETVAVEDYAPPTDGTTDASFAFNAAIAALGTGGGDIELHQSAYAIGAPLSGAGKNIRFVGKHGPSLLTKLASGGYGSFMHADLGVYEGYRFENVAFDGKRTAVIAAGLPGHNFHLVGARNVSFDRCSFREIHNLFLVGCRSVRVENSDFWGTRSGIMTAGTWDPAAVSAATAQYGECSILGQANIDILWKKCRFHFPQTGINQAATQTSRCRGLRIEDCDFRSDWWNAPYTTLRFTPTSIDWNTRILTCSTADFVTGNHFNDFQVLSVPIGITTGTAFSVNGGEIVASGAFTAAKIGDVFETTDGKRAELVAVQDANTAWHGGWESVDTYEPCADAASQNWRLRRYYSSICLRLSATTLQVYGTDFTNPFSGEQLHTDAGLTPVGISCRELTKAYYAGVQINGGQEGLLVTGNRFRGGWADQCSMFDSDAPQVLGNDFRYGQDEGITCTRCERATLADNHFLSSGSSGIFLGDAHHASVIGNTFHIWNVSNTNVRGAIENAGLGMTIAGNTFTTDNSVNLNGSNYAINLDTNSSAGTLIAGNVDGGAKRGTLYVDGFAVPTPGAITVRDVRSIVGPGAVNVSVGDRLSGIVSVRDFLAAGDGSANDTVPIQNAFDAAFGLTSSPHGDSAALNRALYFPPGTYRITDEITAAKLEGVRIFGAGRRTTTIRQDTANKRILSINQIAFSTLEGIWFSTPGLCDITRAQVEFWSDGTSGGLNLQSNTVRDCAFEGNLTSTGAQVGLRIGGNDMAAGGTLAAAMGSEHLVQNCAFFSFSYAALWINGYNALSNTVLGGNVQNCPLYGIHVPAGTVFVEGTGFQAGFLAQFDSGGCDVNILNSANDASILHMVRSESCRLLNSTNSHAVTVEGCHLTPGLGSEAAWQGTHAYALNDLTIQNGHLFRVTTAGTSGGSAPAWNASGSSTTTDGTATWTHLEYTTVTLANGVVRTSTLPYGRVSAATSGGPVAVAECVFSRTDWLVGGYTFPIADASLRVENNLVYPSGGINNGGARALDTYSLYLPAVLRASPTALEIAPPITALNGHAVTLTSGTGSPAGVVSAPVGSLYLRTDGSAGATLYVKESGAGTSGWAAK